MFEFLLYICTLDYLLKLKCVPGQNPPMSADVTRTGGPKTEDATLKQHLSGHPPTTTTTMLKRGLIRLRNAAPRNTRLNSSEASAAPPVPNAARGTRILVVAALLGGSIAGYMAGAAQTPFASASSSTTPIRYGSQKHFAMAITELKRILGEDKVSTEAGDLHVHGYSENDHHEGTFKSLKYSRTKLILS